MKVLINDLLSLARLDSYAAKQDFLPMDLSSTVKNAALSFESLAFEYGKQFTMEIQDGLTLNGNEGNIRQLITILLDNAFKYSGEHGTVSISLSSHGDKKYFWSAIQEMESLQRIRSIFSNVSTEVKPPGTGNTAATVLALPLQTLLSQPTKDSLP